MWLPELTQAILNLEQGRSTDDEALQELKDLRQENQGLRGELQQFHQLKKLLGGAGGNNDGAIASGNAGGQASSTTSRKRGRIAAEALQDIDRAISLIIQWNDGRDRPFGEKWYISFPALQELLRSSGRTASQPRLKADLDNRREEINRHHDKHGLSQKHNARHQHSITEVIALER